jgi:hypothetical protein
MKKLIGYAPALIAFLAMFVGLLGPGRSADKTGLRAITPFGWTSCAIAAASLCVAVYVQRTKNAELAAALASKQQMQTAVFRELQASLDSMRDVLRHAALMPYVTNAETADGMPEKLPYKEYGESRRAWDIDLRSEETIHVLERLYLSPAARLKAPYIPVSVPFGTDTRTSMRIIAEESDAAARRVESCVQKYAAVGLTPEMIAAGSELFTSPFLKHLISLRESWASRSHMEDSQSSRSLNFRFLNSGLTGGYTKDYVEFVERLDRLSLLLAGERK